MSPAIVEPRQESARAQFNVHYNPIITIYLDLHSSSPFTSLPRQKWQTVLIGLGGLIESETEKRIVLSFDFSKSDIRVGFPIFARDSCGLRKQELDGMELEGTWDCHTAAFATAASTANDRVSVDCSAKHLAVMAAAKYKYTWRLLLRFGCSNKGWFRWLTQLGFCGGSGWGDWCDVIDEDDCWNCPPTWTSTERSVATQKCR